MAVCGGFPVLTPVLFLVPLLLLSGESSHAESDTDVARGRAELQRVRSYAATSRYGDCWTRALEQLDTRCRDMTSESQSRVALRLTHCHLLSSGRDFPPCPEGSEVTECTAQMDIVAFNTYTEFFTHTHSICNFLQSEAWQSRAETTIFRLTESSAGVAEQLESTRHMAEDLIEAQSAALQAQQEILTNGEELRATLQDSTQGLKSIFSELSAVSREQQLALSELFHRVSFLQSFLMMEAHSMSSCLYNAAGLGAAFLLTSPQRSSRARLLLLALVCLNFYLERKIYQFVMTSDLPEDQHMELVASYISVLRRVMISAALALLLFVCVRHRDPLQQSLQVLQQLQETQRSLQVALQHAESLGERKVKSEEPEREAKVCSQKSKDEKRLSSVSPKGRKPEEECLINQSDLSNLSLTGWSADSLLSSTVCPSEADTTLLPPVSHDAAVQSPVSHNALGQSCISQDAPIRSPAVSPGRRQRRSSTSRRRSSGSPLVYSILVEDKQCRYSLRSRRSETSRVFD